MIYQEEGEFSWPSLYLDEVVFFLHLHDDMKQRGQRL